MTPTASTSLAPVAGPARPGPDTLVLLHRTLRPGTNQATLSRFAQDRWVLTPALFERHANATCLDFTDVPDPFRRPVKLLAWLMLNHDHTDTLTALTVHARTPRPAVRTVVNRVRFHKAFTQWLHARGITRFGQVTPTDLDAYATDVKAAQITYELREDLLAGVVRAWTLRDLMPEPDRLPQPPPWGGERITDILGHGRYGSHNEENRTPRIHPDTMTMLLSWCLRFVEVFAEDIIAAFDEYKALSRRNQTARQRQRQHQRSLTGTTPPRPKHTLTALLAALLDDYHARGRALPGRRDDNGNLIVNTYHLRLQVDGQLKHATVQKMVAQSGLPIDDDTYLFAPITARLDDRPWRDRPITYDQAPILARHLSAACFVLIAYLSGQRPGETLNLERGCIDHNTDPSNEPSNEPGDGLILLRGKHFKGVRDPDGATRPEGEQRADPWVVVAPVVRAVQVVQQLHTRALLFPNTLLVNGRGGANTLKNRVGAARSAQQVGQDIDALITWVNHYCHDYDHGRGRGDRIPPDPTRATISVSRLRRTLTWFIARRPRGLVAAAIQYGHVRTKVTLGYSGSYASGFPDELAFEEWLTRLDTLTDAHHRLHAGEHISGPAADTYRTRLAALPRFAGRTLRSARDAATLLANPDLQIYPGEGMTCVLDPAKAACRLTGDDHGTRRTPDINDCRPACANIARTDRDIDHLRAHAATLQTIVDDPLAPPLRHTREQHELARLHRIITAHNPKAP